MKHSDYPPLAVSLAAFVLYASVPGKLYTWDMMSAALQARSHAADLPFNVHHPLATLLQAFTMSAFQAAPLQAWTLINNFLAALGLWLSIRIFRRLGASLGVAVTLGLCLAFTLPYWFYATSAELYPLAFVGGAAACLFAIQSRPKLCGATTAVACLLNASHLVLVAPLLFIPQRRACLSSWLGALAAGAALVWLLFRPASPLQWVWQDAAARMPQHYNPLAMLTRIPTMLGGTRDPSAEIFHNAAFDRLGPLPLRSTPPTTVLTALAVLALLGLLGALAMRRHPQAIYFTVLLFGYLTFFALADVPNEFLFMAWLPLLALLAMLLPPSSTFLLSLCAVALFTFNLNVAILPNHRADTNQMLARAQALASHLDPQDALVSRPTLTALYDRYYVQCQQLVVDGSSPQSFADCRQRIDQVVAGRHHVYIEPELFDFSGPFAGKQDLVLDVLLRDLTARVVDRGNPSLERLRLY